MRLFYKNGLEFERIWVKSYLVNTDIRVQILCNFSDLFLFALQHIYAKIHRFKAIGSNSGVMAYFFPVYAFFFIKFSWNISCCIRPIRILRNQANLLLVFPILGFRQQPFGWRITNSKKIGLIGYVSVNNLFRFLWGRLSKG